MHFHVTRNSVIETVISNNLIYATTTIILLKFAITKLSLPNTPLFKTLPSKLNLKKLESGSS